MLYQIMGCSKAYGSQDIFKNLFFEIKDKEKVAIVGNNGIGKSTLLKIISGIEDLDAGEIRKDRECSVGYLSQTVFQDESISVKEELDKSFELIHIYDKKLKELEILMQTQYREELLNKYGHILQLFENLGGYEYENEINIVFTRFGFKIADMQKKIKNFSGGEKTRLAFVKLLLCKPDILLLDEPTNHLDLNTVEWLEKYIDQYPKAVIIVSHDRMFLDKTVNIVYEIENYCIQKYIGNFSDFITQKKNQIARQNQLYEIQQKEIKHLEELINHFRYKVNKAKFAQSKIKYLERMTVINEINETKPIINVCFSSRRNGNNKALEVNHLEIGYDQVLYELSFRILSGDHVAIIGENGVGKSALIKTIAGRINPLSGNYTFGNRIEIGYFDQELEQFNDDQSLIEEIWDSFPDLNQTEVRNVLGRFLFTGEDVFKNIKVLSGGEKVRLALAKLMLRHDNFLLLDEPTNHLDIYGKNALEKSLKSFDGSILFVSHDRYFISIIATAIIEIKNHKAIFYDMPYEEYLKQRK